MRSVRWSLSGLALVALLPAVGAAQSGRNFKDSWFWGVKAGTLSFSTNGVRNVTAPLIGGEWLITRSRAALYISLEQAFFNKRAILATFDGDLIDVGIKDMQRVSAAMLAFPGKQRSMGVLAGVRPYGGLGLALNFIRSATVRDTIPGNSITLVERTIENRKSAASLLGILGAQAQYRRLSVFVQGTFMPTREFLLDERATYSIEGGIRYNFGTSIDRPQ